MWITKRKIQAYQKDAERVGGNGHTGHSSAAMFWMLYRHTRRVVIFVIGFTVVLFGGVLLFFPGPGLLVILGGFALLATEFAWAAILLRRIKKHARQATGMVLSFRKDWFKPAPRTPAQIAKAQAAGRRILEQRRGYQIVRLD